MNARLRESVDDLYEIGGLELATHGAGGGRRELLLHLEMSGLDPEKHEIIRYHAVNRWDENDEFDEWAKPARQLSREAEKIVGTTNELLAQCRLSTDVMEDFRSFIAGAELQAHNLAFDLDFLNAR